MGYDYGKCDICGKMGWRKDGKCSACNEVSEDCSVISDLMKMFGSK